jgi:putative transposase
MPRRRRHCPAGLPVHIVQRGNNKQVCFTSDNDMAAYANWLWEAAEKYDLRLVQLPIKCFWSDSTNVVTS